MNPYPLLLWLEQNGGAVSGGTDASYCEAPQEPVPGSPSTSADLDTGHQDDARPSPILEQGHELHDHSPEQEPAADSAPDENDEPAEAELPAAENGTPSGEPGLAPALGSGGDRAEDDESREPAATDEKSPAPGPPPAPLPPSGEGSPVASIQEQVRALLPEPSRPSYGSVPASKPGKAGQGGEKADPRERENERNDPEPPGRVGTGDGPRCGVPQGGSSTKNRLYITRARDRTGGRQMPIRYHEWYKAVEEDPEMRMRGAAGTTTGAGGAPHRENKGLAAWTGHPACKRVWFDLRDGNVVVENPDRLTIQKMRDVARKLGASVRDNGE